MSDLNHGAVIEDPIFCRCGVKRQNRRGSYFCLNCDSVQHVENVRDNKGVPGVRVRTVEDVRYDRELKSLVEDWYEPGKGADPIFRMDNGKLEDFADVA